MLVRKIKVCTSGVNATIRCLSSTKATGLYEVANNLIDQISKARDVDHKRQVTVDTIHALSIERALFMSDKYNNQLNSALQEVEYYKSIAAKQGQREVLESLFHSVIAKLRDDSFVAERVLASLQTHFTKLASTEEDAHLDSDSTRAKAKHLFDLVVKKESPKMSTVNALLDIEGVGVEVLRKIGFGFCFVPVLEEELIHGVLSEPIHSAGVHKTVCVSSDEKNIAFFAELAKMSKKPLELYNPHAAAAGKVTVRAKVNKMRPFNEALVAY